MNMFKKQVNHCYERFNIAKDVISKMPIKNLLSSVMISEDSLEEELKNNSQKIHKVALLMAKDVTRGKVMSYTYAAAIAVLADIVGLNYELRCGYSLAKDMEGYEKLLEEAKKANFSDSNLPYFANHFYLIIDGKVYEYFNGYKEVEHIYDTTI